MVTHHLDDWPTFGQYYQDGLLVAHGRYHYRPILKMQWYGTQGCLQSPCPMLSVPHMDLEDRTWEQKRCHTICLFFIHHIIWYIRYIGPELCMTQSVVHNHHGSNSREESANSRVNELQNRYMYRIVTHYIMGTIPSIGCLLINFNSNRTEYTFHS